MLLQPQGQQNLLHLAPERPRIGEKQVLRDLLGDRRASLHQPPGPDIHHRRPGNPDHIQPPMRPEPPILHRDSRRRQKRRQVGQPQRLSDHIPIGRENRPAPILQRQRWPPPRIQSRLRPRQIPRKPEQPNAAANRPPDGENESPLEEKPPPLPPPANRGGLPHVRHIRRQRLLNPVPKLIRRNLRRTIHRRNLAEPRARP